MRDIQELVEHYFGKKDWNPIHEMALIAADPDNVLVLKDEHGDIIKDDKGRPVTMEKYDPLIKQRCLEQVASYIQPKLKPIDQSVSGNLGDRFKLNYTMTVLPEEPQEKQEDGG